MGCPPSDPNGSSSGKQGSYAHPVAMSAKEAADLILARAIASIGADASPEDRLRACLIELYQLGFDSALECAAIVAANDQANCRTKAEMLRGVSEARHDLWEACADTGRQIAEQIRALKRHSGLPEAQTPLSRGAAQAVTEGNTINSKESANSADPT